MFVSRVSYDFPLAASASLVGMGVGVKVVMPVPLGRSKEASRSVVPPKFWPRSYVGSCADVDKMVVANASDHFQGGGSLAA